jgi:short-subunit dehydrogenase
MLLSGRRAEVLASLASELGDSTEVLPADLSDADAVRELAQRAGRVDVLVANAALPASGALDDFTPEEIDRALDVNLRSPIHLARALLPAMTERGRGHLVFISSMAGKVAPPGSSLYSATKFGLRGFAFGLREDLHDSGVGVTTVFPGFIRGAGMWADTEIDVPTGVGTRTPEEVAAAVVSGIEKDRAEVDVAPLALRLGGWISGPAPSVLAAFNRRMGARTLSVEVAEAQRSKR